MTGSARTRWTLCFRAKASIKGEGSGEGRVKDRAGPEAGGFFWGASTMVFYESKSTSATK